MTDTMSTSDVMNMLPLDASTTEVASKIIGEQDGDKLKQLTQLFNLNQAKKNVLRVMKLNTLLDKVQDQMIERFNKRPGELSSSDLLSYMQVVQSAIDRANKSLNLVDEMPAITLNQINIHSNDCGEGILSKESRHNVTDAIKSILAKLPLDSLQKTQDDIIDSNDIREGVVYDTDQPKSE